MNNHSDYHSQALTLMDVLKATGMPPVELVQTVIAQFGKEALRPFPEATDHESALYVIRLLHHKYKMAPLETVQWAFDLSGPEAMHETPESSDEDAAVFLLTCMRRMGINSSDAYSFVTAHYGWSALDERERFIEANKDEEEEHLEDLGQIENIIRELEKRTGGANYRFWYSEPSEDGREWILWAAGAGCLPIEIVGIRRTYEAAQALAIKDQKKFRKQWPALLKEAERLMKKHKQEMKKNAKHFGHEERDLHQDRLEMDEKVIKYLQVVLGQA